MVDYQSRVSGKYGTIQLLYTIAGMLKPMVQGPAKAPGILLCSPEAGLSGVDMVFFSTVSFNVRQLFKVVIQLLAAGP